MAAFIVNEGSSRMSDVKRACSSISSPSWVLLYAVSGDETITRQASSRARLIAQNFSRIDFVSATLVRIAGLEQSNQRDSALTAFTPATLNGHPPQKLSFA